MSRDPGVTIAMPWRPSPARMAAFAAATRFWQKHCPDWPIITADSDTEMFNLSGARNNAVRQAQTEIVVVADADTIPPLESVLKAVADPDGITWPHMRWVLIPSEYADRPFEEFPDAPVLLEYPDGLGGVMVCTQTEYWRLGGYPEIFEGWGFEDSCFNLVSRTLSSFNRIGGTAFAIDHNEPGLEDNPGWLRNDNPLAKQNRARMQPYIRASARPWLMREVVARHDERMEREREAGERVD